MSFIKITDPKKRDFLINEHIKSRNAIFQDSLAQEFSEIGKQKDLIKLFRPITSELTATQQELKKQTETLAMLPTKLEPPLLLAPETLMLEDVPSPDEASTQLGAIATGYLTNFGKTGRPVDKIFGIHSSDDGRWYIGNTEVKFNEDNIIVGEKEYQGTQGLWELITSTEPNKQLYDSSDMANYKAILHETHALKRGYDPKGTHPAASRSEKWKNLLAPIWKELYPKTTTYKYSYAPTSTSPSTSAKSTSHVGSGALQRSAERASGSAVFLPSDPNSLLEKLDLLLASKKAGNTGLTNEITAILDELLRQKIITSENYKSFNLI